MSGKEFEAERPAGAEASSDVAAAAGPVGVDPTAIDRPGSVVALQRLAGNTAVTSLIQRQHPQTQAPPQGSATDQRVADISHRQDVLEKRQASSEQDLRWRATFGERISSWRQAILRVSGGLELAQTGFRVAQQEQAAFEALVTQIFIAAATIGFAAGFEPLLTGMLGAGRAGTELQAVKDTVEAWENPAVSAAGSMSNIVPATQAVVGGGGGGPPAAPQVPSGSPMTYLTQNLESLEHLNQEIEHAFGARATARQTATDEQVLAFDPQAQERVYADLLTRLQHASHGVEEMKPGSEVAQILERHIWAAWIKQHGELRTRIDRHTEHEQLTTSPEEHERPRREHPEIPQIGGEHYEVDLGSYVEDRLNAVGVSALAGVTLTGHWYSPNSDGWERALLSWAWGYRETIGNT